MNFHPDKQFFQVASTGDWTTDYKASTLPLHHGGPTQIGNIFASIEKYPTDADVKNRCSTQSGDSCVFPFTYRGKTYSECITTGDINDKPWCSISTNSKGVHIEGINTWGYCKKSLSCHIWIIINNIRDWFISVQITLPKFMLKMWTKIWGQFF